ncbi:MAG: tetratricopeptide repeat-containing sensor histidine kinase [Lacibacter sp.]
MLKSIYILSLLLFVAGSKVLPAQQTDSLIRILERANLPDTTRINTNNLISRNISFVDPIKSLKYAQEALELSLKTDYKKGSADAYRNLGSIYSYFGSFYLTVDNLQRAITGYEELNDSTGLANCYISLGHAYRYLKNIKQEIHFHKQAFEIHSRHGDKERIAVAAHNLGESYLNNHELDKATGLTLFAIKLNDSIKNIQVLSSCYKVMGKILKEQGKFDEAEVYLKKILVIYDSLKEKSQKIATIEAYTELANIAKIKKNESAREEYLHKASKFIRTYYLSNYLDVIYPDLIELYVKRNQPELALKQINDYKVLSDSLWIKHTQDKNQLVAGFTKLYEVEKKNALLEVENELQHEKMKFNTIVTVFSLISIVLTLITIVILYNNFKKVRIANKQLEQKNRIIETQNEKLEDLNRTKDKFFSIVSHDLRAPLSAVSLFTDFIISDKIGKMPKEQFQELAAEAKVLIDNTKKLTADLISWAQVQMKNEETKPEILSVADAAHEILSVFQEQASIKQITLTANIDPSLTVFADANQFRFILRNLINNAIKFTPKSGSVSISGKTSADGITNVAVTDTGIGISKEMQDQIFKVGKNNHTAGTEGEAGSGLGLLVSWEFVQLNQGQIEVESTQNKGTTFTVKLPSKEN